MAEQRPQFRLDGPAARRLRATVTGNGPETVVFAHGLGTDQSVWDAVLDNLPDRYTAVRFDLPGVSSRSQDQFDAAKCQTLAPLADDLLNLLEELGLGACTVVAHSISGMVAALAAIEAPDRFRRLIAINTSPHYLDEPGYGGGFTAEVLAEQYAAMAKDYQAWVAGFSASVIPADAPEARASFAGSLGSMRPDIALAVARVIFATDMRPLLGSVTVPTVLIQSRNDPAVPPAVGHYLHRHLPGSQLIWIDAAGHLPHLSAPDQVAAQLWSHLA